MQERFADVPSIGRYKRDDAVVAIALTFDKGAALKCARHGRRRYRVIAFEPGVSCSLDVMQRDARWRGEVLDRIPSVE